MALVAITAPELWQARLLPLNDTTARIAAALVETLGFIWFRRSCRWRCWFVGYARTPW
jgi:hypothetical protein